MHDKVALRKAVRDDLEQIRKHLNAALRGRRLTKLEPVIKRLGRGGNLPHWYAKLKSEGVLPNLDGKTIGSVLEMLLVAILETRTLSGKLTSKMRVNPARGVDLPDIDLGVKSPSTNYCTSEPFFSAYERLLGNEYDAVVLLTDYQKAKKHPPLRLQVSSARFLTATQVADRNLCKIARTHRQWLLAQGNAEAQRAFCFLAYVNQSGWRAKKLVGLLGFLQDGDSVIAREVKKIVSESKEKNRRNKSGKGLIPEADIDSLSKILDQTPHHSGLLRELDNWVTDVLGEAARPPNANEWIRLTEGPLDGLIGMSFALQWRYNFAHIFGADEKAVDDLIQKCDSL